jgi:hypothetical protein
MSGPKPLDSGVGYLASTASAVRYLLDGIEEYRCMLRKGMVTGPSAFLHDVDLDVREKIIATWARENCEEIEEGFYWQRRYAAERFAMATLCGALLQVAQKGLEVHSTNTQVPGEWRACFGGNLAKFCVGAPVWSIPRGLIVYAARNQHIHFNDHKLGVPSRAVFDRLALGHGVEGYEETKDPAFDIDQHVGVSLAPSVISLLDWHSYDSYESDMRSMLGIAADV